MRSGQRVPSLLRGRAAPAALGLALALSLGLTSAAASPGQTAVAASASASASASSSAGTDAGPAAAGPTVLLVTGDRVVLSDLPPEQSDASATRLTATVMPRDGSTDSYVTEQQGDGDLYVIPTSALPYLDSGLDRSLFDVSALARDGITGSVPVDVTGTAPGVVDGKVTAATAPRFGAALAAQASAHDGRAAAGRLFGTADSIRLAAPGAAPAPAFAAPLFVQHTLRLLALDETGAPADAQISVLNLDDHRNYTQFVNASGGEARVSVPDGRYEIGSFFPTYTAGKLTTLRFVTQDITVSGDTTATVDARTATAAVTTSTPRPSQLVDNAIAYVPLDAGGSGLDFGFVMTQAAPILLAPAAASDTGSRHLAMSEHRESPAGAAQPYTYDLKFQDSGAIGADQHHAFGQRDLASLPRAYYADTPRRSGQARVMAYPFEPGAVALYDYFPAPVRRTEYVVGSPDITYWDTITTTPNGTAVTRMEGTTYRGGTSVPTELMRGLLSPGTAAPPEGTATWYCGACRQGDDVQFYLNNLVDAHGRPYLDQSGTGSAHLQLLRNGEPLLDADSYSAAAAVPADRGDYRLVYDQSTAAPWYGEATTSHTEWTFSSGHSGSQSVPDTYRCADGTPAACSALPLLTATSELDTALDGTMPAGLAHMTVTFGHAPGAAAPAITATGVRVSFDGGRTWRSTVLTPLGRGRSTAWWTNPVSARGQRADLRITAEDAAGGTYTQSVAGAYAVAAK